MFFAFLSFAVCLIRVPHEPTVDSSFFLCDTDIDGSVCTNSGMGVYLSAGSPPPRPTTFYPVDRAIWTFTRSSSEKYLGVGDDWDQPNVSGKFSGVFKPTHAGVHTFTIIATHTVRNGKCRFPTNRSPVAVEVDISYSGFGSAGEAGCSTRFSSSCSDYYYYTNYFTCTRMYTLELGYKYPLFAGALYNSTIMNEDLLSLELIYTSPIATTQIVNSTTTVVGMSGYISTIAPTATPEATSSLTDSDYDSTDYTSSSSTASSSVDPSTDSEDSGATVSEIKKTNGAIVGGAFSGVFVFFVLLGLAIWIYAKNVRRKSREAKKAKSLSGTGRSGGLDRRRRRSSSSGSSRHKSGSSSRHKSGNSSRHKSGSSSRHKSSSSSRHKSGSSSRRKSSGSSHRKKSSGKSHRKKSSGSSHRKKSSGSSHRKKSSGKSNRRPNGISNRVSTGITNLAPSAVKAANK